MTERALSDADRAIADRKTLKGIFLAVAAVMVFATQDAITKHLALSYPVPFFLMIRYWAFFLFAVILARRHAGSVRAMTQSASPWLQVLRGLILVVEMGIFAVGLRYLKLAEMHAIFAIYPLMVTALSVPLLGEMVGWRRWGAVFVGFLGVLVILRPGLGVFQPAALIPLTMALAFALYLVLTRLVSRHDPFETTLLYTAAIGSVAASFVGPFYWADPTAIDWGWIAVLCVTGITGHFLMIKALEFAAASVLQPFNFLLLVWATVIGYLVFSEVPDIATMLGAVIVVSSGLYVIWRERRLKKKATGIRLKAQI